MPPSLDDLSLRHLPDISDASFSFQIPSVSTGDLLLDNDDEKDFFRNADDTTATPGPSRISRALLTLSELTPKQEPRPYVPAQDEPSPPHDQPPKPKRNPRGIGRAGRARTALPKATKQPTLKVEVQLDEVHGPEASPGAARLRTLRAEVDLLGDASRESSISSNPSPKHERAGDRGQPISSKKERIIARPKQIVFSGGISKPRSRPGASTLASARTIPSAPRYQPLPPAAQLVHHASSESAELEENPDISVCSTTSGGVAERLVMYSQNLIGSFGDDPSGSFNRLFNTDKVSLESNTISPGSRKSYPTIEADVSLQGDQPNTNEDPFTLSQISPPKPKRSLPKSPATSPASPMRPSRKRPVSVASSHQPSRKKGKSTTAADPTHTRGAPASNPTTENSHSGSHSSSASNSGRARPPTKVRGVINKTRQGPVFRPRDGSSRLASSSTTSTTPTLRVSRTDRLDSAGNFVHLQRQAVGDPSTGSTDTHDADAQRDKRVMLPPVNPTRPVGFRFQLDARMEARKAEYEKERLGTLQKQRTQHHPAPVPDFKTLHAQQEAELALRKENIHPVLPLPIEFSTDSRAKEREKFDQRVKEKERELERAMEQRRKEREENEEREVRELRKKAIPRAHEVPDWYKEAPKRKTKEVDLDVIGD